MLPQVGFLAGDQGLLVWPLPCWWPSAPRDPPPALLRWAGLQGRFHCLTPFGKSSGYSICLFSDFLQCKVKFPCSHLSPTAAPEKRRWNFGSNRPGSPSLPSTGRREKENWMAVPGDVSINHNPGVFSSLPEDHPDQTKDGPSRFSAAGASAGKTPSPGERQPAGRGGF